MLFLLIAGHALGDYPLQPEAMATCKCRKAAGAVRDIRIVEALE